MTCCAACVDRGLQEKLAFVAIDDDPEKGFVYEAAEVRKEAANIKGVPRWCDRFLFTVSR